MLMAEETVTIYHKTYDPQSRQDRWTGTQYPNASWYGKQAVSVGDKGLQSADLYSVRIRTEEALPLSPGDIVVRGAVSVPISQAVEITGRYPETFVVTAVHDNRRGLSRMRHWRIEGK